MLPALDSAVPHLTDVLPSCLQALGCEAMDGRNALGLPAVQRAVVVLVDGLGAAALKARAGHARHLLAAFSRRDRLASGFPTTTAAALASLTTGVTPGTHGLIGYTTYVAGAGTSAGSRAGAGAGAGSGSGGTVLNQLTGWGPSMPPRTWQAEPTLFERASEEGIGCSAIGAPRYAKSGFTDAVLRGATYVAGTSIADRFTAARRQLDLAAAANERALVYLYIPELDMAAHASGWQSDSWTSALETVDAETAAFAARLKTGEGMLLTADHGMLDIPATSHILFDQNPALVAGVTQVAGDPRCLQLHVASPRVGSGAAAQDDDRDGSGSGDGTEAGDDVAKARAVAALLQAWREAEGERAWVVSRQEAIDAGWFGDVLPGIRSRIGDVLVAARKNVAYYDSRSTPASKRTMIGQHGSWSDDEMIVPLLRFGAFARA